MVHPYMFTKAVVSNDVKQDKVKDDFKSDEVQDEIKPGEVKDDARPVVVEIDVHMEAKKLRFGIVIGRSVKGSNRRKAFASMRCERSGMYRVFGDKFIVRDIFWTHSESIKLFNKFPNVLIIDSTYKTNKYLLSLLKIISVTSTEKSFSVGFAFLESEKEVNVI
ncbi:uncharacterized protein LOC131657758 [Vicia villosa]|uniref:uncharacterized protein LOC131657758 n=1 Tax=Vicia villosa TaxID=3911 RepID=UPI00273B7455|nr:uncharacterized protein LOC131657758 [Vicia villosa]